MSRYSNYFNNPEINARDRIRFALASYNCGPGHVFDARDLAKEMGLDPNKWFGHVEKSMLLLSKKEVAKKVRYGYCAARSRQLRERDSKSLRPLCGDRADAIAGEGWNIEVLGFKRISRFFHHYMLLSLI